MRRAVLSRDFEPHPMIVARVCPGVAIKYFIEQREVGRDDGALSDDLRGPAVGRAAS